MSEYVSIRHNQTSPDDLVWLRCGLRDLRHYLIFARDSSAILSDDFEFGVALHHACEVLLLDQCSEPVLSELARILQEGSDASHPFWSSGKVRAAHIPDLRADMADVASRLNDWLKCAQAKREATSPHQRLCAALRFKAEQGMREFLASHGLKPHELTRIKKRIQQSGWPPQIMELLPLRRWERKVAKEMMREIR